MAALKVPPESVNLSTGSQASFETMPKIALAQSLYDNKNNTIEEICKTLHISRATLYRYIKAK